jgi:PadR family transcriptional regulator PadR
MCQDEHDSKGCGCHEGHGHEGGGLGPSACQCGGGFPRRFTQPAVLLLLAQEPSHGYSLFGKLSDIGVLGEDETPTLVYRVLNKLEADGLASHGHEDEGQGPTRKVYSLTEQGLQALEHWSARLEQMNNLFAWFGKTYASIKKG